MVDKMRIHGCGDVDKLVRGYRLCTARLAATCWQWATRWLLAHCPTMGLFCGCHSMGHEGGVRVVPGVPRAIASSVFGYICEVVNTLTRGVGCHA